MRSLKFYHIIAFSIIGAITTSILVSSTSHAGVYDFPVIGKASFQNDFSAWRGSVRHNAIDIVAGKHQPVIAATSGTITYVAYPQPSWGYMIRIASPNGYEYDYIHLNNDTKGTDDGRGGGMLAFAPGVREGNPVVRGQLLGYVGDSGNAENTVSHLHFEVRKDGKPHNPYKSLTYADHRTSSVPAPHLNNEIVPYGEQRYNLNIALGDIDKNGSIETVVAAGKSSGPKVKIYNASKTEIATFYPFQNKRYTDGIDVAVGDINNDGQNEIIVGGREGDGSRVATYVLKDGAIMKLSEFVVDAGAKTIVRVTAADTDGDGTAEIITATGAGQPARVKRYTINGTKLGDFKAFGESFLGGIDVAAGDVSSDSKAEIVVSRLTSGSALLRVFNSDGSMQREFGVYDKHQGGARVAVGNVVTSTAKLEIVATPTTGHPLLRTFNGDGIRVNERYFLENWWEGYYDPAAANGITKTATGINRRGSVQ